jgi:hypothetical protein
MQNLPDKPEISTQYICRVYPKACAANTLEIKIGVARELRRDRRRAGAHPLLIG